MTVSNFAKLISIVLLVSFTGCSSEADFCEYLTIDEARQFDPAITSTEMRQTERILYCVYKSATGDRLFISLDSALKYSPENFLGVVAKNSPEEYEEIRELSGFSHDSAALFLGNEEEKLKLEFLIGQNKDFSVSIRAKDVTNEDSEKLEILQDIAQKILSRI